MSHWSAHFGCNAVDPAKYAGWDGELYAAVSDAVANAALFAQHGFSAAACLNEKATLATFRKYFRELATRAQPGDTVVLTFSGHGSRSQNWNFPLYRESICLWDGQLADTELRALIENFNAGVKLIIILDCCHAGGMDRGAARVEAGHRPAESAVQMVRTRNCPRFVAAQVAPEIAAFPARGKVAAQVLFLTACRADEVALDGLANGAFTGSTLRSREQFPNDAIPTWGEWHEATRLLMLRENAPQHPQAIELGAPGLLTQRLNA